MQRLQVTLGIGGTRRSVYVQNTAAGGRGGGE